ncbi:MAG TPA: hypothetical protein VGB37_17610 [Candidatus Lokiarchaeia archaeon]
MIENRLLTQYNNVVISQWLSQNLTEEYSPLNPRELFELSYHTVNNVGTRNIFIKLSPDENKAGSKAILYSNSKKFISIDAMENKLSITRYFNQNETDEKLINEIAPKLKMRKEKFAIKEEQLKEQLLKAILVERKLDECANLVMVKDINRKIYFSIGDARESAAVVPLFMEAEGASTIQLALNKWMSIIYGLDQESLFPESHLQGLLKNLLQIKNWLLNLISINLDK